jgi:hypothetical protein
MVIETARLIEVARAQVLGLGCSLMNHNHKKRITPIRLRRKTSVNRMRYSDERNLSMRVSDRPPGLSKVFFSAVDIVNSRVGY